ncbi:hypothetical protein F511_43909 [Dorcoceras hygrometricum]|uniref:Uncharacterized protein n=1 Tax=Dorcoceras hygrometricum TaxID=472368 RepID=A0A2Z7AY09_9LAMI|nr:hypothetical protein F511_43909 [Dorcoceras hygrometricum]
MHALRASAVRLPHALRASAVRLPHALCTSAARLQCLSRASAARCRAAIVRWPHEWRDGGRRAPLLHRMVGRRLSRDVATRSGACCTKWPDVAAGVGDAWRRLVDARCALVAERRARCRRAFCGGGAAGWPPLRRVSGDVVTAGLISSRVWFGPVPGSP